MRTTYWPHYKDQTTLFLSRTTLVSTTPLKLLVASTLRLTPDNIDEVLPAKETTAGAYEKFRFVEA